MCYLAVDHFGEEYYTKNLSEAYMCDTGHDADKYIKDYVCIDKDKSVFKAYSVSVNNNPTL